MDATVPLATTRTTSESARSWNFSQSTALLASTLTQRTDVLPVQDHARPAHQPPSASLVPILATNLTQLEFALPSVVMDSSSELRLVTLETPLAQDASAARSNLATLAVDSPQSAGNPLPLLPPLLLLLLRPPLNLPWFLLTPSPTSINPER